MRFEMKMRIIVAMALAFVLAVPSMATAQVPAEVPVQGFLTDDTGVPYDGSVSVEFKIYDAATGGSELHSETTSVDADAGAFTTYLNPSLSIFSDNQDIYLGLAVDGEAEMSPRLKMATVPYAAVAGNAATVEGMSASDFAPSGYQPDWSDVQNVPTDLADGDDGTSYTASAPVEIDANDQIGLITSCPDGNILKWDSSNSQWLCAADEDTGTTYTAGSGVEIGANDTIGLNSTCSTGQVLKWNGSQWDCQTDEDTTYLAGAGLQLTSNQFAVDYSQVQQRVSSSCASSEKIIAINADGTVTCAADIDTDTDTNTTYSAGAGLGLSGTTFSVDTSSIQARVSGSCAANEKITGVNADGTVQCGTDIDTDTNTTYSAGTGMDLSGTTFSVASGGISSTEIANGTISNADVASNAGIAPGKIAGTAATLNSSPTFTGTVTGSDVKLSSPKTGHAEISPFDLVGGNANELDDVYLSSVGYFYIRSTATFPSSVYLRGSVELPHGATVTSYSCTYYDDYDNTSTATDDLELTSYLRRFSKSGTPTFNTMASVDVANSIDSSNLRNVTDSTIANATVDTANYRYGIYLSFTAQEYDYRLRFYGCSVEYTYDTF
jgi:hypothetical protein